MMSGSGRLEMTYAKWSEEGKPCETPMQKQRVGLLMILAIDAGNNNIIADVVEADPSVLERPTSIYWCTPFEYAGRQGKQDQQQLLVSYRTTVPAPAG